ncbi:MAG: beta strand repeat-containing protein, partial [Acidobacteriota bacterium]
MKKLVTALLSMLALLAAAGSGASAQSITSGSYAFSRSGFAPTDISTGSTQLIGPNADDAASAVTDIGFTFWFAGTPYTQFSVNENGLLKLGSTAIAGNDASNSMASSVTLPKIAPYWDDLATGTNGKVVYKLTGTAPNRVLIINWNVTVPKNTAGAANALIQVQLSETSGNISFTYGSPALAANSGQYSIGIGVSATDFASVTPTSATAATCAYGTANNANTMSPGVYTRYNFMPDAAAPTITYTPLAGTASFANRMLTATIADARTGVPTSGSGVPRIYYKKNFAGSYVSSPGTLTTGSSASGTWSFTIDHTAIGGVIERDSVYYFVIAQDQAAALGAPNRISNPSGAVASDVNTVTAYPASPAVYKILGASISGTKTVGTSGADYTSLTNPGGLFTDINDGKLTGNVNVQIITDLTAETGAVGLNAWTSAGGPFTVTITPVGARTVSGSSMQSAGLIALNGANGLTIDGLNDGVNSLTLSNTNASTSSTLVFKNGASNNTITNTTLKGVVNSSGGVIFFGDGSASSGNNNNTISRCVITAGASAPFCGIYMYPFGTQNCVNNVIDRNVISNFAQRGIHVYARNQNLTISNNEIYQTTPGTAYSAGIYVDGATGTTNVFNNRISGINTTYATLGTSRAGIAWASGSGTVNIYNNTISLDAGYTGANGAYGLSLGGTATYNVYYNSIYIGGTNANSFTSAGLYRSNGTLTFRNNVIFNARSLSAPNAYYKNYGIQLSNTSNLVSNNNVIYANGTSGVFGAVGSTDYASIGAWKSGTLQDSVSFSGDPGFTSASDLMPDPANPNSNILNNRGIPVAAIVTDIAGQARSTTGAGGPTDIGAFEFTPLPVFYTITGNAGIGGATLSWMDGTPKTTVADDSGNYSITVPYGWTGSVVPSSVGYTFTPNSISYDVVTADAANQNYSAAPSTNTISGSAGMPGVTISWMDGTLKTAVTDGSGSYAIAVPNNWSGTVTPSRTGYAFTPASIDYANVLADVSAQNYAPAALVYTISGNAGVPLAALSWSDTTAKSVTADVNGNYSITVSYNWSGTITPALAGHVFMPAISTYAN